MCDSDLGTVHGTDGMQLANACSLGVLGWEPCLAVAGEVSPG